MSGLVLRAGLDAADATRAPLLTARGLSVRQGRTPVLHGVDLDLAEGRRTVLLGPNGAGKSVLLRALHGLIGLDAGRVLWRGRAVDGAARRAQAMVFQRPVMLRRSARANLRFALAAAGVPRAERAGRADAALERAGLHHLARRPARVLSGGEQQRLALARALLCEPDLLLLDEPTASLDPAATAAVEAMVREASLAGVTVLMVTHDRGQARRLGEDALFLHGGRVAESGPAERLLDHPRSPAARAWVEGRLLVPTE